MSAGRLRYTLASLGTITEVLEMPTSPVLPTKAM
jgi:hypothetical protein